MSWCVWNRHRHLPGWVPLGVSCSSPHPREPPVMVPGHKTLCVHSRVVCGSQLLICKVQNSTRLKGGLSLLLMIVYYQLPGFKLLLLASNANTHTHILPTREGAASQVRQWWQQARVRLEAWPVHIPLPTSLSKGWPWHPVPLLPPKRGTKSEIWDLLQYQSSAVPGNVSWMTRSAAPRLPALQVLPLLPVSPPRYRYTAVVSTLEGRNSVWYCAHGVG